jgi:hypothetical protein
MSDAWYADLDHDDNYRRITAAPSDRAPPPEDEDADKLAERDDN